MRSVLDLAEQDTTWNGKASTRREKKGPCPGCGGTDRFSVKQDDNGRWVFMCRRCWEASEYLPDKDRKRGWGDAYDYLRHFRKMKHDDIKALLGEQEEGTPRPRSAARARFNHESDEWQRMTAAAVKEYEDALWSPDGAQALDYIKGRGLSEKTIKAAHIGYSTKDGIPRLVFPVFNEGRYTSVSLRNLRPDCEEGERWTNAPGSTKDELYLAGCLKKAKLPTIVVEGAIDALSIAQECAGMVNVVATDGATGAQKIKPLAQLALMPSVFIAFDADKAGDEAAKWWLERLPNARRLRPFLHDINDILTDGWDLRSWIGQSIHAHEREEALAEQDIEIESPLCSTCCDQGIETPALYEVDDTNYCAEHHPGRLATEKIAQQITAALPDLQIKGVHHVSEWPAIKAALIAEMTEKYAQEERERQQRDLQHSAEKYARKRQKVLARAQEQALWSQTKGA